MALLFNYKIYFIVEHAAYERVFEPLCNIDYQYTVKVIRLYKVKNRLLKLLKRILISFDPNALIVCCTAGKFFKPFGGYRIQLFHAPASFGGSWDARYIQNFDVICPVTHFQLKQLSAINQTKIVFPIGLPYLDKYFLYVKNETKITYDLCYAPSYHQDISSIFYFLEPLIDYCRTANKKLLIRPHPLLRDKNNVQFSGGIDWHSKLKDLSACKNIFYDERDGLSAVMKSAAVITDTSGLAYEFASVTGKPIGFIGNKLKIPLDTRSEVKGLNIHSLPEVYMRNVIGPLLDSEMSEKSIEQFMIDIFDPKYESIRSKELNRYIFNLGSSASEFKKLIAFITTEQLC